MAIKIQQAFKTKEARPMTRAHSTYFRHGNENDLPRLQARVAQSHDAVSITDRAGAIVYVNSAFEALTGYLSDEVVGKTYTLVKSGLHPRPFYANLWSVLQEGREFRSVFVNRKKNGDLYHEEKLIRPFVNARGEATHFVSVGRDVSDTIRTVKRMKYLATHDLLTGLPNRALFEDRLRQEFAHAKRLGNGFALCFLDVDKLKPVNDLYGHSVGDQLLRVVAGALKASVRDTDTAARLSGDEFGLILAGVSRLEDAQGVLAKIFASLRHEAAGPGCQHAPSISVGACLYPQAGIDERMLLVCADQAMYRAKAEGGGGYCFFDPQRDGANATRLGASLAAAEEDMPGLSHLDTSLFLCSRLAGGDVDLSGIDYGMTPP